MTENSNLIRLSGHHLRNCRYYYKGEINEDDEATEIRNYGKEFFIKAKEFWARFLANPEQKVLIVYGGDDICKFCRDADNGSAECNLYLDIMEKLDKQTSRGFGLEVGKVYTVSEVINAIDSKVSQ